MGRPKKKEYIEVIVKRKRLNHLLESVKLHIHYGDRRPEEVFMEIDNLFHTTNWAKVKTTHAKESPIA